MDFSLTAKLLVMQRGVWVVGRGRCGHRQCKAAAPINAALDGLRRTTVDFGPVESLLDPFAVLDLHRIAVVSGGSAIHCLAGYAGITESSSLNAGISARLPGDTDPAQVNGELGSVEAAVGVHRQLPCRSGGVAMDHVQCRASFGKAVGPSGVALHDRFRAVRRQGITDEAEHRPGSRLRHCGSGD